MLAGSLDLMGGAPGARGSSRRCRAWRTRRAYPWTRQEREFVMDFRTKIFVGSPATVRTRLDALVAETGADELMVATMAHDHAARNAFVRLLAEAFGLNANQWRQAA